jgi:hypothetical protein
MSNVLPKFGGTFLPSNNKPRYLNTPNPLSLNKYNPNSILNLGSPGNMHMDPITQLTKTFLEKKEPGSTSNMNVNAINAIFNKIKDNSSNKHYSPNPHYTSLFQRLNDVKQQQAKEAEEKRRRGEENYQRLLENEPQHREGLWNLTKNIFDNSKSPLHNFIGSFMKHEEK